MKFSDLRAGERFQFVQKNPSILRVPPRGGAWMKTGRDKYAPADRPNALDERFLNLLNEQVEKEDP
ncbi:MAG TPA: hypothetical protein VM531_09020 [Sphingomicrobium sp.]|jgi:hypothetical protein|nr:hypothetical protein [Sphingomicrobium sp.]